MLFGSAPKGGSHPGEAKTMGWYWRRSSATRDHVSALHCSLRVRFQSQMGQMGRWCMCVVFDLHKRCQSALNDFENEGLDVGKLALL